MCSYLTDARDKALLSATPTLMAPHFGKLPPCDLGTYRFVAASNGLFIQARTHVLDICACINRDVSLPYGAMEERVTLLHGEIGAELYATLMNEAQKAAPNEWAGIIVWDPSKSDYVYHRPPTVNVSSSHISYLNNQYDPDYLLLDAHSHGHGPAFFSKIDDASDQGIHLSLVFGKCGLLDTMEAKVRICVHGYFIDVPAEGTDLFQQTSPVTKNVQG